MLPATASATVKVRLTTGTENTSYNYSCPQALEANHEVSITGQFVDNSEVRLEGSITGAVWGTPIVVDFTFGTESSTSSSDPVTPSGESAPAVNSLYKDCFVLSAADDASGEYTIVTLLHKNARDIKASDYTSEAALTDAINAALPDFAINGVTGWRLPTHDEMQALQIGYFTVAYSGDADATAMGNNFYYCTSGTDLKAFVPSAVSNILDYSMGERLRPVTTLSFRK